MIKIDLPKDVKFIIGKIEEAGYEAYAVGGCIRDILLGKKPGDYDITTSAAPDVIKGLFRRTFDTGIEHGTVTVLLKDTGYEVTTYRTEGKYEDSRHPSYVSFTDSLNEDLLRRDFTINAMAYNDKNGLVDPFDGQKDLKDHIIRCVGDPMERLSEDALRMMRAIRFSAQLDYEIEDETKKAIEKLSSNLENISKERINTELVKLVMSPHPDRLITAHKCGLLKEFLLELDQAFDCPQNNIHHCYDVGTHSVKSIEYADPGNKNLRLALLFHDLGKTQCKTTDEEGNDHFHGHPEVSYEMTRKILKRLKFDNNTSDMVSRLVRYHDRKIELSGKGLRRAMNELGPDLFPDLFLIKEADVMAQSEYKREEKLNELKELNVLYEKIIKDKDCVQVKDLCINGNDLMDIGYRPGRKMGDELNKLLRFVIEDPSLNNRDYLIESAKEDLTKDHE